MQFGNKMNVYDFLINKLNFRDELSTQMKLIYVN